MSSADFPYYTTFAEDRAEDVFHRLQAFDPSVSEQDRQWRCRIAGVHHPVTTWVWDARAWLQCDRVHWKHADILSDFFSEPVRMRARKSKNTKSPYERWRETRVQVSETPEQRKLQREFVYDSYEEVNRFSAIWSKAVYMVAASIVDKPVDQCAVLDTCAGWGDRLLAAIALNVASYTGYDPNPALQPCYRAIVDAFGSGNTARFFVHDESAESIRPYCREGEPAFDIAFTSPPFFAIETYCDDPRQTSERYGDVDDWLEYFAFVMLRKTRDALREGGVLALHLVDTRSVQVIDRVYCYVTDELDMRYEGVVCLQAHPEKTWPVFLFSRRSRALPNQSPRP